MNSFNPEPQLKDTEFAVNSKLIDLFSKLIGFQFVTTLVSLFKKIESEDKTKYDNFYSSSKAEIIINESDIDDVFQSIYTAFITNIQKALGKDSDWIIDSVTEHNISISKYNPLAGSSYIKLLKELDHPRKGLINIQNIDDNECFKWSIAKYLNPANHHQARITKADKDLPKKLDFKDTKFPVKLETSTKVKKRISSALVFLAMRIKEKHPIYVSKNVVKTSMLLYY